MRPARSEIAVAYLDGPFTHLDNRWRFRDVPGGSEIDFYIDYAFRDTNGDFSSLVAALARSDAFTTRRLTKEK